jgi:transposase
VPQRRRHSVEEKRRIVEETLQPGASVARVARTHGVNANQVFAWRRQYRQGLLEHRDSGTPGLLAVRVVNAAATREAARSRSTAAQQTPSGMIQVELPKGHLRIGGRVDAEALRVVLEKLLG